MKTLEQWMNKLDKCKADWIAACLTKKSKIGLPETLAAIERIRQRIIKRNLQPSENRVIVAAVMVSFTQDAARKRACSGRAGSYGCQDYIIMNSADNITLS